MATNNKRKSLDETSKDNDAKKKTKNNGDKQTDTSTIAYEPFTLQKISSKINDLCAKVPQVPESGVLTKNDLTLQKAWASDMQETLEGFNLLLACVSPATYKWSSDRSGAADQNLGVLSSELANAQDQISSAVSPKLSNVLAPVVDLVVKKMITEKGEKNGNEVKTNEFTREVVDPDFVKLCGNVLARNAGMLRQVVLANFNKAMKVIADYEKARSKDDRGGNYGSSLAY
mmetsp:Transcript_29085/g.42714  ORF Transcript_29085/g.42714 Transcript_29085/m.42714 type:complete len:230 (-) Transcript_29085:38-727(-)|eukprot:CAMPEP_0116008758 /NCGR_PEP_ID=MMETSP0321-20121206/3041_1 /TAXON_ID=163516 /ORGANISM="Leptocylindrus danicus var. danicus, Strain B650" /LENGTH=229 /DNA_ID=CAMNT_0003477617 /DNA_START=82 /DNA_END=771 /DNA_ORIENTATION=+